jgi:hypothetical protein
VDPLQRLPAFRITCPISATDPATRIEITTKQEGRVLLEAAAQVEVRHDEQAQLDYNAAAYGANKPVANSSQFRNQLLADLNQVRTAAGVRPFALEARQSVTDPHGNARQQGARRALSPGFLIGVSPRSRCGVFGCLKNFELRV